MDIHTTEGPVTVIAISGDLDSTTAPQAQERILPLAQPGSKLLLEMSGVAYMSSAGLRLLLSVSRQVSRQAGRMVLVGLSAEIKDVLAITGFLLFFTTCDTLDEGLRALA